MSSFSQNIPILFVEGGIGCGKSTLVKKIQEHCNKKNLKVITIQEPVDIWVNIKDDKTGKNMIEAFYDDQEKYSFEFQMMAYISRLQRLRNNGRRYEGGCDLVICEKVFKQIRMFSARCFMMKVRLLATDIKSIINGLIIFKTI